MPNYRGFGSLPLLSQRTGVSRTSKALFAGVCCAPAKKVWQCSDSRMPLAVQTEPFIKSKPHREASVIGSSYSTPDSLGVFKFCYH